ncbi:MAG: hypothetical protein KF773_24470 [Deltaproteobacteria bacterium]|nr:hypothetical protein [Deltaproteobacteria bacterium]MCW5804639.1 hypothetical protein [Deltaproteobacteria bacterium]
MRTSTLVALVFAGLVSVTATARAERPLPMKINIAPMPPPGLLQRAIPAPAEPSSRIVYMRRCPLGGCIINPGGEDSRNDQSSIAGAPRTISRFKQSDLVWDQLMSCMRATYAPFNVAITDIDPGNVPHYEHVVGGNSSTELNPQLTGAGGVSPFTCGDIPNAMTFTFDVYGPDPEQLCWTAAQEVAHAFGLEHEINDKDPLTYLSGPLPKRFQPTDTPCGEFQARPCDCGGLIQNSFRYILDMFGPGVPTPPQVTIKSPAAGKKVQPRFVVRVEAIDDTAVEKVELFIDGVKGTESMKAPYKLIAPDGIAEGPHTLEVRATDIQGTPASSTIDVVMGPPCTASKGCDGNDVCVMGVCLAGPGEPGGMGNFCQAPTECISNQCLADTTGNMYCVEGCDGSSGSCPDGFSCLASANVCWPAADSGCCQSNGSATGPTLFGLGVLAALIRRRRARA